MWPFVSYISAYSLSTFQSKQYMIKLFVMDIYWLNSKKTHKLLMEVFLPLTLIILLGEGASKLVLVTIMSYKELLLLWIIGLKFIILHKYDVFSHIYWIISLSRDSTVWLKYYELLQFHCYTDNCDKNVI